MLFQIICSPMATNQPVLSHSSRLPKKHHRFRSTDVLRPIPEHEIEIVLPRFQQLNTICAGIMTASNYKRKAWCHLTCLPQPYCHLSTNTLRQTYGVTRNGSGRRKNSRNSSLEFATAVQQNLGGGGGGSSLF